MNTIFSYLNVQNSNQLDQIPTISSCTQLYDHIQDHPEVLNSSSFIDQARELVSTIDDYEWCDQFFKDMVAWGVDQGKEKLVFDWLQQVFTLSQISHAVVYASNISDLSDESTIIVESAFKRVSMREETDMFGLPRSSAPTSKFDLASLFYQALYYPLIPFSLYLDTINFTEINKHYSTLWEKSLIVQVFTHGVLLSYYFGKVLAENIMPTIQRVAGVAGLIALLFFGVAATGLFAYYRWIRYPDDIAECTNCLRDWTDKESKIPRPERQVIFDELKNGKIVCLHGQSGEGKTSLVEELVSAARRGEFHKGAKFFALNLRSILSTTREKFSVSQSLDHVIETVNRYGYYLIIDNFHEIFSKDPGLINNLLNRPWKGIIVSPTFDWNNIKAALSEMPENSKNSSGFLKENVVEIVLEPADRTTLRGILWNIYHKLSPGLPIDPSVLDDIIDEALKGYKSQEKGSFTNIIALVEALIKTCKKTYEPQPETDKLKKLQKEYRNASTESEKFKLKTAINAEKKAIEKLAPIIQSIKDISNRYLNYQREYLQWRQKTSPTDEEKKHTLLANIYGFEAFQKKIIDTCNNPDARDLDLIINKDLLRTLIQRK